MMTRDEAIKKVAAARRVGVHVKINSEYDVFCVWADIDDVRRELEQLSPDTMIDLREGFDPEYIYIG